MRNLIKENAEFFGEDKVKKQEIIKELNNNGFDINDQLALIFNILEENLWLLANTKHKEEFITFLQKREEAKKQEMEGK